MQSQTNIFLIMQTLAIALRHSNADSSPTCNVWHSNSAKSAKDLHEGEWGYICFCRNFGSVPFLFPGCMRWYLKATGLSFVTCPFISFQLPISLCPYSTLQTFIRAFPDSLAKVSQTPSLLQNAFKGSFPTSLWSQSHRVHPSHLSPQGSKCLSAKVSYGIHKVDHCFYLSGWVFWSRWISEITFTHTWFFHLPIPLHPQVSTKG